MTFPRSSSILLLALAAGCGSDKPEPVKPVAGDLTVSYSGGTLSDGALLVVVTGEVTSIAAKSGYQIASAPISPTSVRIVVTGSLTQGDLFTVRVPDVAAVSNYGVTVEAAADRATFALNDPIAYQLAIRR